MCVATVIIKSSLIAIVTCSSNYGLHRCTIQLDNDYIRLVGIILRILIADVILELFQYNLEIIKNKRE